MLKERHQLISMRSVLLLGFLLSLSMLAIGVSCQSSAPGLPSSEEPASGTAPTMSPQINVTIEDFVFKPDVLTIPVGTTVIWRNSDSVTHTVTARDTSFGSGSLAAGDTFSYTSKEKGTFEYFCRFHPRMTGKVTLE